MAAVDIVVTDENGLPVFCNVAAIRTSDQTIVQLAATDSEGKVSIAASGTWYPRPMVSPNYKSRIKLTILNNRHAAVYDYVVDSTGGGTHLTMREMMAAFLAEVATVGAAIKRSCWLALDDTDTNIEISNADINVGNSTLVVEGAGARRGRAAMIFASVSADDAYFRQTARYSPYMIFKNLRIEGGGSSQDGAFMYFNGGATQSNRDMVFINCDFGLNQASATNTNPILRLETNSTGASNTMTFENCSAGNTNGGASSFIRANSVGPTAVNRLVVRDCEMTLRQLAESNAINTVHLLGGKLVFTDSGFNPSSSTSNIEIVIRGCWIEYQGTSTFITKANLASAETRVIIQNVQYTQTSTAAAFLSVSGNGSATDRLFMDDVVMRSTAGVAAGPAITVGASMDTVWIGDVTGWNFTTVVSGATPVGTDHGTLSGLSDDDHTIYPLLLGRATGQTLLGGVATGEHLKLRSNAVVDGHITFEDDNFYAFIQGTLAGFVLDDTTNSGWDFDRSTQEHQIFVNSTDIVLIRETYIRDAVKHEFHNDANFYVEISSSNPRIVFDGAGADRMAYDRTNNRLVIVIGNTEEHRFVTSGYLALGYVRVGSLSAPGNTTPGDLTAIRVFINNDSLYVLAFDGVDPTITFDTGDVLKFVRSTNVIEVPGVQWKATASGTYRFQKGGTTGNQTIEWDFDTTTTDPSFRLFRNTNTSGIPSFSIYKGDNTTTKIFEVRSDLNRIQFVGNGLFSGYTDYAEIATPATPSTGFVRLYAKSDGDMYQLDDVGTETNLTAGGGGGGHTIRENGTDQTARTGLNFVDTDAGAGLITDDAGGDETEVNLNLYVLKTNANFVDLTDGGATTLHSHAGGSGHTIQDDNSSVTARTNLSFQDGFIVTDDAGGDQTEIDLDYGGTSELANPALTEAAGSSVKVPRADHVHGFAGWVWMPIADWFIGGPMRTDTTNHLGKVIKLPDYATAVSNLAFVGNLVTAPTGSAANFDVKYSTTFSGALTSLFSTTPTIAASANEDSAAVFSPTTIDGVKYLRLYCTQKGSTVAGTDLSVQIWGRVYVEF